MTCGDQSLSAQAARRRDLLFDRLAGFRLGRGDFGQDRSVGDVVTKVRRLRLRGDVTCGVNGGRGLPGPGTLVRIGQWVTCGDQSLSAQAARRRDRLFDRRAWPWCRVCPWLRAGRGFGSG